MAHQVDLAEEAATVAADAVVQAQRQALGQRRAAVFGLRRWVATPESAQSQRDD